MFKLKKYIIFIIILSTSLYASQIMGEYQYNEFKEGSVSTSGFFSEKGAPYVYVSSQCRGKGKNRRCWPVIRNQTKKILASYGTKDGVGGISSGRYQNIAYLYYSHTYKRGKDYYTDYYLMDDNGRKHSTPSRHASGSFDSIITKNKKLLQVSKSGVYINGQTILNSPTELTHAKISNNLRGDISIVAIDVDHHIQITNTKEWKDTNALLARKGDRSGVLSVYPKNSNEIIYSVYKYVNSYNKGLILGRVNFNTNENITGWLFNSENRNVGFDPEIYVDNGSIYLSATNSSERSSLYTVIPNNKSLSSIKGVVPKHIIGFEDEKNFSFLVGTSLSSITWQASNKVEDEDGNSFGELEYEISDSIYKAVYLQGKIGDRQLAISHLKNEAEAKGGNTKKASEFLNVVLDLDGFFSPQSSLRIVSEQGTVNGLSSLTGINGTLYDTNGQNITTLQDSEFETTMKRLSFFVMKERGLYHGLDYTEYIMPSLLGYGKDGNVLFTIYDPKTNIKKLTYNWGYDELSYAKRYENNFSRFYFQGLFGIGLGQVTGDFEKVATQKATSLGYDDITSPITFAVDYALDFGYIWQKKSKTLKGLGFSTQLGYKVRGTYFGAGTSSEKDEDSTESNDLSLEFSRNDIWHGPYVSVNIIF